MGRIVRGQVMHRRISPVANAFNYPVFYLLLRTDRLEDLNSWLFGVNRLRPLSVHDKDYAYGLNAVEWVQDKLANEGIHDCDGDCWLQTFPRVFGFVFNPVSFWFCFRSDGSLGAVLAEVNNTFGERHVYAIAIPRDQEHDVSAQITKKMYVSPFYPVAGGYRFRFKADLDQPRVGIDYYIDGRLQLVTAIWGQGRDFNLRNLCIEFIRQPIMTLGVIARIHWQAFKLWRKGITLFSRTSIAEEQH